MKKETKPSKELKINKFIKRLKISNFRIDKIEMVSLILLIVDIIAYFSLNRIINIIIIFLAIMSLAFLLIYILGIILDKKGKREKYIDNMLGITVIIHILVIGIFLGQICYCGNHYYYIVPLIIYEVFEIILYHIFIVNYKKEKSIKYALICFLAINIIYIIVMTLSKVDMEKIHKVMYII